MEERLNCVILAAGMGTRMRSALPKVAHPIMGKPMIRYVADVAASLSPEKIVVVTGHRSDVVEECLAGMGVSLARQTEQLGTAHALLTAEPDLGPGDILVLYGDVPLIQAPTLAAFIAFFRRSEGVCFMTTRVDDPSGYGRVIVGDKDAITGIVEDSEAEGDIARIDIINTGICMIRRDLLSLVKAVTPDNKKHEFYLTDVCKTARAAGVTATAFFHPRPQEVLGINDRVDLLEAATAVKNAILERHMKAGVTIMGRETHIEADVVIGQDTVIYPDCYLMGKTEVGRNVFIGPHVVIKDSIIGDGVSIEGFSSLDGAKAAPGVRIGPFSRLRPNTVLAENVHIGNFVELKNATIGEGTKANHLTYIGDADVGAGTNIGAGTITCNYDGKKKHRTTIGDRVFVGSNTELVAPVRIGNDAFVGAGSTITRNVPDGALAVTRAKQKHIEGYSRRKK
jgi:bifunctional UDP-N-acetylglucosamine pyrophosphorylase/glucosamine-1-phosphate N-acetyltransferase